MNQKNQNTQQESRFRAQESRFRTQIYKLPEHDKAIVMDIIAFKTALYGHYRGNPMSVIRGFLLYLYYFPTISLRVYAPLLAISALVLTVGLACTLTALPPPAALLDVQNSPTPSAATATKTQTFLLHGAATKQTALPTGTATTTPQPQAERCEVNTQALNVRACAGLECYPVAWLYSGDVVTITHPGAAWLEVNTGELTGFIKSEFCE